MNARASIKLFFIDIEILLLVAIFKLITLK